MKTRYLVLGAGMQGVAAAYDFAKHGNASQVILTDVDKKLAEAGASRINQLIDNDLVRSAAANVRDQAEIASLMQEANVCLSAVPYYFNEALTRIAIASQCHFCDLGGNTEVVFKQHEMHQAAIDAGVTIAPDCGLAPGMANILAAHGIRTLQAPKQVYIRVGGLPQNPKPPLGYTLSFSIEGLTNEYFGKATVLRNGKVTQVNTFTELEALDFPPPIGTCEAFMTAGGASTCPWTFEGAVQEFDEKTIRYPGHYDKMKTIHELGLLDLEPVEVDGQQVVPRHLFHAVATPVLKTDDPRDVVLLRVTVRSDNEYMVMQLIDYYDDATGFTAMQRTTGFGATIVGIMLAKGELPKGCIRIEQAVDSQAYMDAMAKRGFALEVDSAK